MNQQINDDKKTSQFKINDTFWIGLFISLISIGIWWGYSYIRGPKINEGFFIKVKFDNIFGLTKLGAKVMICAPPHLIQKDILELGMFEILDEHIKIVEWPELIQSKPSNRIDILFEYSKLTESRKVKIIGSGKWKDYKFDGI